MFDFLKNLTKQAIAVAVVMLIVFMVWPGLALAFFVGVAVGLVAGNLYAPIEAWVEKQIANYKSR